MRLSTSKRILTFFVLVVFSFPSFIGAATLVMNPIFDTEITGVATYGTYFFETSDFTDCQTIPNWVIDGIQTEIRSTGGGSPSEWHWYIETFDTGVGSVVESTTTDSYILSPSQTDYLTLSLSFPDVNVRSICPAVDDFFVVGTQNYWFRLIGRRDVGGGANPAFQVADTDEIDSMEWFFQSGVGNVDDLTFILQGQQLGLGSSTITSIVTPPQGVTNGATSSVPFIYNFTSSEPEITQACVFLINFTTGQNLIPVCQDVTQSGGLTFSQTINLEEANWYFWKGVLLQGTSTIIFETQDFSYQAGTVSEISILPEPQFESDATSTLSAIPQFFVGLPSLFKEKHPVAWIFDIQELISGALVEDPANLPSITYDFSQMNLSTDFADALVIEVFSEATIAGALPSGFVNLIRNLIAAVLWTLFAFFVYRRSLRFFG